MSELNADQIKELAKSAETGNGCAFRDQFVNMNFDEQLKAMKDLREQRGEVSLTDYHSMRFNSSGDGANNRAYLKVGRPFADDIFVESVDLVTGEKHYSCSDNSAAKK